MFSHDQISVCSRCYVEEDHSNASRRHRSNQKSVIFTRTNFSESYQQSPGFEHFEKSRLNNGFHDGMPIDLHIDLGNYCNLACKMCKPQASSVIASQHVKWGIDSAKKYIGTDWTKNDELWTRVLKELASIPKLNNIHFMGGETLLTSRFENFVDFMIEQKRFDLNFSFVTNGTVFNKDLIDKLKKFKRVGIEVSVETLTPHNEYVRQGTDNSVVIDNIERYLTYCNNTDITVTLRPAVSVLTVGHYHTVLKYCLDRKLLVKSLLVNNPEFLDVRILPDHIRQSYCANYESLISDYDLDRVDSAIDYNESDPHQIDKIIKNQLDLCLNILKAPRLPDSDKLMTEMVQWCRRWDNVYKYNALELYPELSSEFIDRGY